MITAALRFKVDPRTLAVVPDDLEAFGIANNVLGTDFYGPIIDTLQALRRLRERSARRARAAGRARRHYRPPL